MNFKSLKEKCNYFRDLADHRLMPNSYVLVMVDGRSFSNKIKSRFKKPFDAEFISMMNETARYVCNNIPGVKLAYTQSDEISFVITDFDKPGTDSTFGFRLCKLQSIIASLATGKFNQLMTLRLLGGDIARNELREAVEHAMLYEFDCKAWNVPNENEVYAWFLYRQIDCVRNSKQQAAQTYLSHKQLMNLDTDRQVELLLNEKGIDWNGYSAGEKWGRFVHKAPVEIKGVDPRGNATSSTRMKFCVSDGFPVNTAEGKERLCSMMALPDVPAFGNADDENLSVER